ncbi:FkbM family methyltransferase [Tabrizicola flagellatus]|uniref:FkbM family methyltransferase n=1 Tax=Tabrizicola flagellatus TaxID=2593021 RepID=UPI003918982F
MARWPEGFSEGTGVLPRTIAIGNCSYAVEEGAHRRFWKRVNSGVWEPETFAIFDEFIGGESLFLDVGAWIGPTALYGVQRAARCIAFEPDPLAFAELEANVAANRGQVWVEKLELHQCAINSDGRSFILGGRGEGGDSMSSALFPNRTSRWTVEARRLHDVLATERQPGQPVFIKIDIEGGEYELLPAIGDIIADPLVTAYVSFHPRMLRNSLAATNDPMKASVIYVDQHLSVIESLPWSRRIAGSDGAEIKRDALEDGLKRHSMFPREILIRS